MGTGGGLSSSSDTQAHTASRGNVCPHKHRRQRSGGPGPQWGLAGDNPDVHHRPRGRSVCPGTQRALFCIPRARRGPAARGPRTAASCEKGPTRARPAFDAVRGTRPEEARFQPQRNGRTPPHPPTETERVSAWPRQGGAGRELRGVEMDLGAAGGARGGGRGGLGRLRDLVCRGLADQASRGCVAPDVGRVLWRKRNTFHGVNDAPVKLLQKGGTG